MALAYKLIPHFIALAGIALVFGRGFAGQRVVVVISGLAGSVIGVGGGWALLRSFPGNPSFDIIRGVVGASYLLMWCIALVALYRSAEREQSPAWSERLAASRIFVAVSTFGGSAIGGALCICTFAGTDPSSLRSVALAFGVVIIAWGILAFERVLPRSFTVSAPGMAVAVSALLLFNASSSLRLDLFAPLTMKVMKFTHDFVHQFFESMLIPDHGFFTSTTWSYIGFLFSNGVGFWGALIIWFSPAVLVIAAHCLERLPQVAHIRQGARRRKLIAEAVRMRHLRLAVPAVALVICGGAIYESRFPQVEYWDPKPMAVSVNRSGELVIPKKGETDLDDGKLHKYLYKQGEKEARFFILKTPDGKLTVDLDACAICKPDGYGQTEGTVICYYCKTLIPLETVGKPGGCNPVPIAFTVKADGVHIDGLSLINTWNSTVQTTTKVKGGGK